MPLVVPKEGPRAPLFFAAALALLSPALLAQSLERSELEHCATLLTPEAKLACFEALLIEEPVEPDIPAAAAATAAGIASATEEKLPAIGDSNADDTATATPENEQQIAESPSPDPVQQDEPAPVVQADTSIAEDVPAVEETAVMATESAAAVTGSASAVISATGTDVVETDTPVATTAAGTSTTADDFGADDLGRKEEKAENEILLTTVTKVTVDSFRRLSFTMDGGQVWRQTTYGYIQYPKGEAFDVIIKRGMLGDYQLRVGGEGRMTHVVRIK